MKHNLETYKLFFGSLANPNRLQILIALREQEELSVNDICSSTGFEQTMVSHNLKRLERCGMVFMKPNGKQRMYSINQKSIKPLMALIDTHMSTYCVHVLKECHSH